jgi:hypothetical protein
MISFCVESHGLDECPRTHHYLFLMPIVNLIALFRLLGLCVTRERVLVCGNLWQHHTFHIRSAFLTAPLRR